MSITTQNAATPSALSSQLEAAQQRNANLLSALQSARRIGAAVGIIMATRKLTYDAAFALLSDVSQAGNRKLRDVADDVVRTGAVP